MSIMCAMVFSATVLHSRGDVHVHLLRLVVFYGCTMLVSGSCLDIYGLYLHRVLLEVLLATG
jgi:hypothetical protein